MRGNYKIILSVAVISMSPRDICFKISLTLEGNGIKACATMRNIVKISNLMKTTSESHYCKNDFYIVKAQPKK